jgi:hypothetical protein
VSPNKGMKLTSAERIERSQLIPGVRRTGSGLGDGDGSEAHEDLACLAQHVRSCDDWVWRLDYEPFVRGITTCSP